ncbi:MAG: SH3 domain-containing protein [Planctomycetota bacterium]|jgi:uncharacterized protein YgiM (DUF1202 family)
MRLLSGTICGLFLASLAAAQGQSEFAGEVTATKLKLRAGPGEAYQPVVTVEKGSRLVVLGRHANDTSWYQVEVPQGYTAWVFGKYVSKRKDGIGQITTERLLVRPRPSTRYQQLSGRLNLNERVTIVESKPMPDGVWHRIRVPRRFPLYAHASYLRNIGPASLARTQKTEAKPTAKATPLETASDKRFTVLEPELRQKLARVKTSEEVKPLKTAVAEIDRSQLSLENRERRVQLLADMLDAERKFAIRELQARETTVKEDLERRLQEIERRYKKRLLEIRQQFEKETKPHYVATGIVQWVPDIFGRYPSYRLVVGGRMKYYLIATEFDLGRFVGKRVGVTGISDPESGTGYYTVMVRRIEILGDE